MIVVTLMGGLGNQMFQYAFGRGMSALLGRRLTLDLTALPTGSGQYLRPYALGELPLHPEVRIIGRAGRRADHPQPRPWLARFGPIVRRTLRRWVVRERDWDEQLDAAAIPGPLAVCYGYWQSPRYFESIAQEIRQELMPGIAPGGRVQQLLAASDDADRVVVHVRRGDYATEEKTQRTHGLLDPAYFERAVEEILRATGREATVIVLSEDSEWCERELRFAAPTIFAESEHPLTAHEALALMAHSDHHVIANSSLSWWGAWLGAHPSQQVLYPNRWFVDRAVSTDFRFPPSWRAFAASTPSD